MQCPVCGYEFPSKPKHDVEATAKAIMVTIDPPKRWKVTRVEYKRHEKVGKVPSLRVTYMCEGENHFDVFKVSEWICIEHDGYPRQKAVSWWLQTHKDWKQPQSIRMPSSVDDALKQTKYLRPTVDIVVQKDGKFERIVSRTLGEYIEQYDPPPITNPWETQAQNPVSFEDDDIPF